MSDPSEPADPMPREARLQILQGQRAGLPDTTGSQLHAIQGDITDADAIARGTATVAAEVINEVSSALVRIKVVALVSEHGTKIRYPKFRVRYLLDQLFGLVAAQEVQSTQGNAWAQAQDALVLAVADARTVRNSLIFGLEQATDAHPVFASDFARVRGKATRPEMISASLDRLATELDAWLLDPERVGILEAGCVGPADVTAARNAATSLERARRRVHEFPAASRDLPGTNLVEGRLMIELTRLHRALELHQGVIAGLPRLPLGDTLRREMRRVLAEDESQPDPLPEGDPKPVPTDP